MRQLPGAIQYSETLNVPVSDLMRVVKEWIRCWSDTTRTVTSCMPAAFEPGSQRLSHRVLLPHFEEFQIQKCPFNNLPERNEGHWGDGLTAAKMGKCRWLDPFLSVVRIEFLEWTPENRLRHARFAGIRSDKDAREVVRDGGS